MLYNGERKLTINEMKLSDTFKVQDSEPMMELVAKIIDINHNSGEVVLNRSSTLQGYSLLIDTVRKNQLTGMTRDKAIAVAIDLCIESGVLTEFLTEHYLEVSKMLNWEYDADAEKRVLTEEGRQQGLQEGMQKGLQQGMQQGVEILADLLKNGTPLDEALEKVKSISVAAQQ